MSTSDRGFFAPLSFDLRVRERMLGAGVVSPTDIQQYLAGLPDHDGNCESLGIPQPALAAPQPPAPPPAPMRIAPAPATHMSSQAHDLADDDDDEDDDEDEDEDDDDLVVSAKPEEAPAAPVQAIAVDEPTPGVLHDPPARLEDAQEVEAAPAPAEEVAKAEDGGAEASPSTTEEQAG